MSWKRVKNFLIMLLLTVNAMLVVFAYNYFTDSHFTDKRTAENAAAILEKSGITVSPDMLSVQNDTANILYTGYDRESYVCLAASILFGKEADGIYMLPEGVRAETLEGEVATIGYDMSLNYVALGEEEAVMSALKTAEKADDDTFSKVRTFLEGKLSLPSGTIDENDCTLSGEYTFVTVKQSENSLPLYGMRCVFGLRGEKIVYAFGKHFFEVPEGEETAQLLNRVNILVSEKERGVKGDVQNIELCYTLYEEADNGRMLFIPSYALTYADGSVSAVNAISKNLY